MCSIYVCISLYLFFIFVLCLGYLGFKEFLFRMAQTIISMFALRIRAAHLLLRMSAGHSKVRLNRFTYVAGTPDVADKILTIGHL